MSHVKDILEAYKVGFGEGRNECLNLLDSQNANFIRQLASDRAEAYERGLADGAAKPVVNDPRMFKKINGIKLIKDRFGLSLQESKDLYEAILDASGIEWRIPKPPINYY